MALLAALHRLAAGARGFSVTETVAVMTAGSMLTAVAAPAVDDYIERARMTKAMNDTRVIAGALMRLTHDMGGRGGRAAVLADTVLLVSAGEIPHRTEGGDEEWVRSRGSQDRDQVGLLSDHLVTNHAGYAPRAPGSAHFLAGWRGPYIDGGIGADPWGHRFAVNVLWLSRATAFDTVVLSVGPDGAVQTAFGRDGLAPGGDDLSALVSSGR